MHRRPLAGSLALAALLVSGCGGGKQAGSTQTATQAQTGTQSQTTTPGRTTPEGTEGVATIALHGARFNTGPWARALSLELAGGGTPTSFYVCAVLGPARPAEPCRAAPGRVLPRGATMRLEQRPIGPAVRRPDSPGWGLVATSEEAELGAPLSNFVSGNRPGTVTYRVTLRNASGRILATSNSIRVVWHR